MEWTREKTLEYSRMVLEYPEWDLPTIQGILGVVETYKLVKKAVAKGLVPFITYYEGELDGGTVELLNPDEVETTQGLT